MLEETHFILVLNSHFAMFKCTIDESSIELIAVTGIVEESILKAGLFLKSYIK